jgi:hypothetical protein
MSFDSCRAFRVRYLGFADDARQFCSNLAILCPVTFTNEIAE